MKKNSLCPSQAQQLPIFGEKVCHMQLYFLEPLGFTSHLNNVDHILDMTDPVKKVKDASQDVEAKMKTSVDHAKGKPSSETLNKAKVKVRDALT